MGDLQIQQPAIIHQIPGEQKNHQEVLNSVIEKQKQTIIEGMKKSLLKAGVSQEKIETLRFDLIGNIGVVINSKGEVHSFYKYGKDTGVEYYTSINGTFTDYDLDYALRDSGYQVKNGKLFKNGQEISQFLPNGKVNTEFVRGVDNINFYEEIQRVYGLMKTIKGGDNIEMIKLKSANNMIISGVARIKDVMYFAGKGYIPNDDIPRLLKRAVQELPNQCSDTRFYQTAQGIRMGMEVTKSELDEYLKPTKGNPLISQKMYDDCLRRIEVRDKKINEMNGVKEQGKTQREVEKTRNGFVDRVKGILEGLIK
ncbi:MAG: hypothetical protein PHV23_01365 [Candidatus Gracilibacteria bacterium]|nr:hypothetical protein [Candidatus Gracilibacteria bacterium]